MRLLETTITFIDTIEHSFDLTSRGKKENYANIWNIKSANSKGIICIKYSSDNSLLIKRINYFATSNFIRIKYAILYNVHEWRKKIW